LDEIKYDVSKVFGLLEVAALRYEDEPCIFILEGGLD
jgi:hypothetical protein